MKESLDQRLYISIGCINTLQHICDDIHTKHIEIDVEFLDIVKRLMEDCRTYIAETEEPD